MRSRARRCGIGSLLSLAAALAAPATGRPQGDGVEAPAGAGPWRVVVEGVAVELDVEPLEAGAGERLREGDAATFRLHLREAGSGEPLADAYPVAWMALLNEGETPGPQLCKETVKQLLSGSLFDRPELDLNTYYVLVLNDDASLHAVDPLFGFGGSRPLATIPLSSPGEDWALTPDQQKLFVSLPGSNRVAVVDTVTLERLDEIEVGTGPGRLALEPDGHRLWALTTGSAAQGDPAGVTVVDVETGAVAGRVATGAAPREIAFRDDGRYAFVANHEADTVSVIDAGSLTKVGDLPTGDGPISLAYSAHSASLYASHREGGTVAVVDGHDFEIVHHIEASPGLGQIRLAPGGRLALLVDTERNRLLVIDAASRRIVQEGEVEEAPFQVLFTDELAYVLHRESEIVLMVPLAELGREGAPLEVIGFPGGEKALGGGSRPTPADALVEAPGNNAVLLANPADEAVFFYKEGMAAPMGHFTNHGREPRAVLAVDRSLRELHEPGTYETTATLGPAGRYQVAVFVDALQIVHCFDVTVGPNGR